MKFRIDYETTSNCDISYGAFRYASDPSTRILMFAISKDDAKPLLWNFLDPECLESLEAKSLLLEAVNSRSTISAFNAMFEYAISKYRLAIDVGVPCPAIEQMRCTRAMALRAAIPASLARVSEFLKLGVDKDARGKSLIGIFSDQSKIVTLRNGKHTLKSASPILESSIPWDYEMTVAGEIATVRQGWQMFMDYCRQDVVVEGKVDEALKPFELNGTELEGFLFDMRMNDRGVPVNVEALSHAQVILDGHQERMVDIFQNLTGLMPTQTAKVLAWLKSEGYPADNLQAETMEKNHNAPSLTPKGKHALYIRSMLSFAAVKKIPAMANTVCPDNRMRGLFNWHGAQRTGRWTSSGPQLQNAKKPTIKDPDGAYAALCAKEDPEIFEMLYGNPYESVASCVRNFIQPPSGMILDLDLASIELRLAGQLADQTSMVDCFREGRDLYKELAAQIFNTKLENVTKDMRFVGKTASLACIYGAGAKTFFDTCAMWGQPIKKELASITVRTFRKVNDQFQKVWSAYQEAALQAMKNPGKWFEATRFVKFGYTRKGPFPRLIMRLPSGRDIIHPHPKVETKIKKHKDFETGQDREWETETISFYGQLKGTVAWGWVDTYGASIFQTSVQATARDIMQHGCLVAEKYGFEIFSLIHDQALAEEGDPDAFTKCICQLPEWMPKDFPLEAEGALVSYYKKD